MTDLPDWAVVSLQVLGGATAVVVAALKTVPTVRHFWREAMTRRAKATVLRNARALRHLNLLMREWLARKGAQRVLLLHARNTGLPWPPDKPVLVSCLDQVVAQSESNTWERWQDWRVDPAYRQLLHDLLLSESTDRGLLVLTSHMEPSVLRDAYQAQGTHASVVFALRWLPDNALLYVSINFGCAASDESDGADAVDYEQQARAVFNQPDRIRSMAAAGRQAWNR